MMMNINKRKIVTSVLLSIVTFGIYSLYWMYLLVKNTRAIQNNGSRCTGEVLCLLFVPFYSIFWWFTRGKIVKEKFAEMNCPANSNEIAYLILCVFGLGIVAMAIMQNDFNSLNSDTTNTIDTTKSSAKNSPMIQNVKSVGVLVAICSVIALLLAGTNALTAPIIAKNSAAAANEALLVVMPDGTGFEQVDLSTYELPATVTEAYKETSSLGYVVKLTTKGYGSDFVIMCGVDADGIVTGAVCLSSNETLGKEKEYGANFAGKDAVTVEATDTISGATLTTEAYKNAVKDAINTATILGGGSVDIRTEEQILADNLAMALPEGDSFTKWFETEIIKGVDAIYVADNHAGYVCVIGEEFVGVDANGISDNKVAAKAVKTLRDSMLEDVNIADTGINENIQKVQKTASGNYVIEINGLGFGYFGDSHAYQPAKNIPMVIKVSLTADGKIIDCLTVSHQESEGYGAKWGAEEYYSRFDGTTAETYSEVEGVSGATISNTGYFKAIERCFEAVSILEGGAK